MMVIKHILASIKDKKPTIRNSEVNEFVNDKTKAIVLSYNIGYKTYELKYNKTRNGTTWYAENKFPIELKTPKVGEPILLEVEQLKTIEDETNK